MSTKQRLTNTANTFMAIQLMILGCAVYLVLTDLGISMQAAGNVMLITFFAAALSYFMPMMSVAAAKLVDWRAQKKEADR